MSGDTFDSSAVHVFLLNAYRDVPGWLQVCRTGDFVGQTFTTDPTGLRTAATYVVELNRRYRPQGVYFRATTLKRRPGRGQRGGAQDTLAVPYLWADIDYGTEGHAGTALPPTEADAYALITEARLPEPTTLIHSGGGLYPLWRVDLSPEAAVPVLDSVQANLAAAAERHGWSYGTGVGDLARVLRVPGSVNRKTASARLCRVIGGTGQMVPVSAFPVAPAPAEPVVGHANGRATTNGHRVGQPGPLDVLARAEWSEILEPAGWTLVGCDREGERWLRPGDPTSEYSARAFPHNLVVHSEAAGLPPGAGQRLTKGRVWAHLNGHGDDLSAAARDLRTAADPSTRAEASEAAQALPEVLLEAIWHAEADHQWALWGRIPGAPDTQEEWLARKDASRRADGHHQAAANGQPPLSQPVNDQPPPGQPPPTGRTLELYDATTITMKRVRWALRHRIVLGGLTLCAGREGLGKSTIGVEWTAQATRGELDGELKGTPANVLYLATEDSLEYTVVPRLKAAGADLAKVRFARVTENGAEGSLVLPRDIAELERLITQHGIKFVVLDAATSVMDRSLDGDRDRQMRQALEPIGAMADRTGCAVLGIVHFGKRDSSDTGKLILGSIAWSQVARSVLAVARDDDADTLVITTTKANLAPAGTKSLSLKIKSEAVETGDGTTWVGRVEWLAEVDRDARDLLAGGAEEQAELTEAEQWLINYFASRTEALAVEVLAQAVKDGLSKDGVKKAKKRARIVSRKATLAGGWVWARGEDFVTYLAQRPEGSPKGAEGSYAHAFTHPFEESTHPFEGTRQNSADLEGSAAAPKGAKGARAKHPSAPFVPPSAETITSGSPQDHSNGSSQDHSNGSSQDRPPCPAVLTPADIARRLAELTGPMPAPLVPALPDPYAGRPQPPHTTNEG